jgi:hypothetical protein
LACPFFLPTERFEAITVPHPARLPLGVGWRGVCTAPQHENQEPDVARLAEYCNVGYAGSCPWRPRDAIADAIRFSIASDRDQSIHVFYVCEWQHHPGARGTLQYDLALGSWRSTHSDPRIQRQAHCYLEVYLSRRAYAAAQGGA